MFNRITSFVTRHPKRVIALWAVLTIGLAMVAATHGYKVTTDDTAQFLPKGSESAQATRYGQDAFGQQKGTRTVTALVKRADGKTLSAADRAAVQDLSAGFAGWRPATSKLDLTGQLRTRLLPMPSDFPSVLRVSVSPW